jgi:hypothetical protein
VRTHDRGDSCCYSLRTVTGIRSAMSASAGCIFSVCCCAGLRCANDPAPLPAPSILCLSRYRRFADRFVSSLHRFMSKRWLHGAQSCGSNNGHLRWQYGDFSNRLQATVPGDHSGRGAHRETRLHRASWPDRGLHPAFRSREDRSSGKAMGAFTRKRIMLF